MDRKHIQDLSSSRRNQECLNACQKLIQNKSDDPFAWKYAGKSLLAMGQIEEAKQYLTKAHQLNSNDPEIIKDIGNIYNILHNEVEAIRLYKAAISIDNGYAPAINNLGLIAKRQGNLKNAKQLVKRACDLDPSYAPYYMNLGGIYKDLGNLDQALAYTLKSLELNPDNPDGHMNLGIIYKDLNKLDQALASTLKALELNPDNPDGHMNLGIIYKDLNKLDQALASTIKALELEPNNAEALINLGSIQNDIGNLDQALSATIKSLELKPENSIAHMNLGSIYKEMRNFDQALAFTRKSLELNPDNPEAQMNLGGIYKYLGNLDQALIFTIKSLKLKPSNTTAHINLSSIYKDMGELDQALASALRALEIKPNNPDALINLGDIYKDLERIEDAKTSYSQALRLSMNDTQGLTTILDFYDSINDEKLLEKAIHQLKNNLTKISLRVKMYEARLDFKRKKYKDSWAKLPALDSAERELKDWFSVAKYHTFRGQIAEKNKYFDEAYNSFVAAQMDPLYVSIDHTKEFTRVQEYITLSNRLAKNIACPGHFDQTKDNVSPVFLIGFPRSGTTLLDTVLRSHPEIEVLEEKDPLTITESLGIANLRTRIADFNLLPENDINKLREAYFARQKYYSKNIGKIVIDKLPLHTIAIPLINLLFPNAKIIFAVRHPCDTVLSCFQQTFKPNGPMSNFTSLERSVVFYDQVMKGWINYNVNLRLNHRVSKYEDLVDHFEESVLHILNHLNLDWSDNIRNYRDTAINGRLIRTPSSSQVVQPIYNSSIGRWRNYERHFLKHMNKLNPWIDYFKYDK